jgi:cytochrome d ubiquinol oxidase subunit I
VDSIPYYPVNEFGPAMRGMVIGAVGIVHVFLAQFAIGGGMLLTYLQWRAGRGDELARRFIGSFFKYLVLVSFVVRRAHRRRDVVHDDPGRPRARSA